MSKILSMKTRLSLAVLWLVLLGVAGWAISQRLELSGDLRKFMPAQAVDPAPSYAGAARAADAGQATAPYA